MVLIGIKRELVAHLKHGMKCMSDKRYGTQWWRKPAQLQLKKYPLCAICLRKGQIVPAQIANHIVPHKENETAFWFGALQSLCATCHSSTKAEEERFGFSREIGVDGWPIDQRHPIYA